MAEAPVPQTPAPERRHGPVRMFLWLTLSLLSVAALFSFTVAWKSMLERRRHVANPPTPAPTEWPTSTATPTPTPTATPSATPTTSPPQWTVTWQAAAGVVAGQVIVTNPGPGPVTMQGWPRLQIVDSQGRALALTLAAAPLAAGTSSTTVTLTGGERASLNFSWRNWCAGAVSGPLTVRVFTDNLRADVPVRGPDGQPQGGLPRCDVTTSESLLSVSPFVPGTAQPALLRAAAWVQLGGGAAGEYGVWPLAATQAGEFVALLKGLPKVERPFAPGQGQGYHGLSLTAPGDGAGLPSGLRAFAGLIETQTAGQTAVYADAGGKIEQWLLASGRPYLTGAYYDALVQAVARTVATPAPGVALASLHMVDAQNGWALGAAGTVLRTRDGGAHWANVTPKDTALPALQPGEDSAAFAGCFLDTQTAWIASGAANGAAWTVLRTFDGGANWQRSSLAVQGPSLDVQLAFADQKQGWAMVSLGVGLGSNPVSIYSTADGGATWALAASGDPAQAPAAGAIPSAGLKTGIARRDATTGWVTGLTYAAGEAYLYATGDGGRTWSRQQVDLPAGYRETQVTTLPPRLWGGKDGVLPARFTIRSASVIFFTTHDGGATWQAGPLLTDAEPASLLFDWASDQLGWCTAGPEPTGSAPLFRTTDGGRTWQALHPAQDLAGAVQLEFVDAQHGWALLAREGRFTGLLRTEDGGASWKPLVPEAG